MTATDLLRHLLRHLPGRGVRQHVPDRVRALALEGVLDPKAYRGHSIVGPALDSDGATQSTMDAFFRECDAAGEPRLRPRRREGRRIAAQVRRHCRAVTRRADPSRGQGVGLSASDPDAVSEISAGPGLVAPGHPTRGMYSEIINGPDKDQTTAGPLWRLNWKQQAAPDGGEGRPLRGALPPAVDNEEASHHGVVCADRNSPRSQAVWPRMAADGTRSRQASARTGPSIGGVRDLAEQGPGPLPGDFAARTSHPALIVTPSSTPTPTTTAPSPSPAPCQVHSC